MMHHRDGMVTVPIPEAMARRFAANDPLPTDLVTLAVRADNAVKHYDDERMRRRCGIEITGEGLRMPIEIMALDALSAFWWYRLLPTVKQIDMDIDGMTVTL